MSKRKNETVRANSSKTITRKAVLNVMADSILENCSVSVKANCIGFKHNGKRSMIRFRNRDIQYLAHLTDRNWTSAVKIKYLHMDSLCQCYQCFVWPTLDQDSFLKVACVVYEPDIRPGIRVDFSVLYELAKGKTKMEPAIFLKELESNEKVQAVVREIKRHMLIHKTQVENEKWSSFTSEYSDAVTNITAAYILCLLDTLAKQGQRFKENPKFDNLVYHTDLFSMTKQSVELAMFINGAPD